MLSAVFDFTPKINRRFMMLVMEEAGLLVEIYAALRHS